LYIFIYIEHLNVVPSQKVVPEVTWAMFINQLSSRLIKGSFRIKWSSITRILHLILTLTKISKIS